MKLEKYKGQGLTGLSNLGNTCFLNSTIQCLSHCYEFNEFLNNEKWRINLNEVNDSLLLIEWDSLRKLMWSENCVISPGRFVTTVQKVSAIKQRDLFTGFAQNDLPEFLLFLMDCLHNSINRSVKINITGKILNTKDKLAKQCYEMIKNMYSKDYSEILDIFYGTHVSIVKDINYKTLNNTPEPYFLIDLPIPEDSNNPNLYDCFDLFTKEELLSGDEKYDNNGEKIDAFRQIKFWSFPKVLVIDLKRFKSNGRKNNKLITFPLEDLTLVKYCIGYNKESYIYDLFGICNHSGGTLGGHYTAYVKNANDNWYHFNDTIVKKVDNIDDLISNKAYCLFYRKKNIDK